METAPSPEADPSPEQLGRYTPLIELASGGMAVIYAARQAGAAGFGRIVVVKRVHRHLVADAGLRAMLLDEAYVASLIRHANVVSVTDVLESGGELCLVMEYVESASLSTLLEAHGNAGERLPTAVACRIVVDMLSGLHAAHEVKDAHGDKLGVIHRDVSPQNVIIGIDGHTRLVDFGIAKAAHRMTETRRHDVRGKLPYMAPEQLLGAPIDRRVDVFAAGVVLHETLTNRRLFSGRDDAEKLWQVLNREIPAPSSVAGVPPALDAVVHKALQRDPARRFQSAHDFLVAIENAAELASTRDVAACVEEKCSVLLAARREKLTAALAASRTEPLDDAPAVTRREIGVVRASYGGHGRRRALAVAGAAMVLAISGAALARSVIGEEPVASPIEPASVATVEHAADLEPERQLPNPDRARM